MPSMFKRGTPRTKRSKREMEKLLPKIIENPKKLLILKAQRTSDVTNHATEDLFRLKMPNVKKLHKHNPVQPFENAGSMEFLSHVNDTSLMAIGSHQKKRPHNLVLARFFDSQVLDMVELGIVARHDPLSAAAWNFSAGSTMLCFLGDWTGCENVKTFLYDFFRGPEMPKTYFEGLERVLVITAVVPPEALLTVPTGAQIYIRHFAVKSHPTGGKVPKVELEDIGPSMDVVVRRTQMATDEQLKRACRQPVDVTHAARGKRIKADALGQSRATVHVGQQKDFGKFGLRKFKAFKVNKAKERMERKRARSSEGKAAPAAAAAAGAGAGEDSLEKPVKRFRRDRTDREVFVAPQRPEKVQVPAHVAPQPVEPKKKRSKAIHKRR